MWEAVQFVLIVSNTFFWCMRGSELQVLHAHWAEQVHERDDKVWDTGVRVLQ